MNTYAKLALSVTLAAMCLPTTSALARKPPPPKQYELVQAQIAFWNESNTDEFRQAETNLDYDTMKSLMSSIGFVPDPKFQEIQLCPPPYYWYNVWSSIYGPNPADGGIVEWYMGWMPVCSSSGGGGHPTGKLPVPVFWNPN